jgi:hypothetical protein
MKARCGNGSHRAEKIEIKRISRSVISSDSFLCANLGRQFGVCFPRARLCCDAVRRSRQCTGCTCELLYCLSGIEKARTAFFNSGHRVEDHFVGTNEMIEIGRGAWVLGLEYASRQCQFGRCLGRTVEDHTECFDLWICLL